jgi:hypothetical protein
MSCGNYAGAFSNPVPSVTPTELICRGSDPNYQGNNLYEYYSQNSGQICTNEFSSILYGLESATGIRAYDPTQLQRVQSDIQNIFATYQQLHPITNVNSPGYNPFQEVLTNMCHSIPGICGAFISGFCNGCSREQVSTDSTLLTYCGCNIPNNTATYGVNSGCDSLCNRAEVLQNINPLNGISNACAESVCIIDSVSINAVNTTINNGIVFSQLCSSCKDCACIFDQSGASNIIQQAGITTPVQLAISCGEGSTCYNKDINGNLVKVLCPTNANFAFLNDPVNISNTTIILIIIVVLILVIAIVLVYLYNKKE